jgi:hypothetical protein
VGIFLYILYVFNKRCSLFKMLKVNTFLKYPLALSFLFTLILVNSNFVRADTVYCVGTYEVNCAAIACKVDCE